VIDIPENEQRYAQWARRRANQLNVLDIDLYGFLSGLTDDQGSIALTLPSVEDGFRSDQLADVLREDLRAIEDHELWSDIVGSAFLAGHLGVTRPRLEETARPPLLDCGRSGDAEIAVSGEAPWIRALEPILQSLTAMYLRVFARVAEARELGAGIHLLPEWTRTYPRRVQARFASLGAWEADPEVVPAFLVDDAAFVPVISPVHNFEFMRELSPLWSAWASAVCESGFVRIRGDDLPEALRPERGRRLTRLNEVNVDNPPVLKRLNRPQPSQGYLIDRHYQALFEDNVVDAVVACYGPNERLKDACMALLENVDPVDVMRVKHWSVPVLEAASVSEVESIVDVVTSGGREPAYFRGQTRQYYLDREGFVNELLYGTSYVSEPSLPGAAARRVLSYDIAHPALQCLLQDFAYELAVADGRSISETHDAWLALATSLDASWDAGVMAIAQHYGVPTDGIDITSDLDVALWFATNRFVATPGGEARYVVLAPEEWASAPAEWPALFVIQPPTVDLRSSVWSVQELRELRLNALRPERQRALFFMGATGIHQNRLAEALSCVIRLRPGVYPTPFDYGYLFPSADEDPVYRFMLDCRARCARCRTFLNVYLKEIPIYSR
jgi:FRG domain